MTRAQQTDWAAGLSPALARAIGGRELSRVQRRMRECNPACALVGSAFVAALGASATAPLSRALVDICAHADRSGAANAYHNPAHSREVAVNWLWLAILHQALGAEGGPLSTIDLMVGLCAAFGHDLGHNGRGNMDDAGVYRPFWLEASAAKQVAARMAAAGSSADAIARVRCAILLTDSRCGYPVLEASLRPDFDIAQAVGVSPAFAPLANPTMRLICAMLRDADLMPSAAMPARDHDARTREMLIEQGREAVSDRAGTEAFLSGLVGGRFLSPAGARFQGDLDHLSALNAARGARRGDLAGGAAEADDDAATRQNAAVLTAALGLEALIGEAPLQPISW